MTSEFQSQKNKKDELGFYSFLEEKISKLSTAVYMVTSYMHDDEPLKKNLRVASLETLSHSGHLSKRHDARKIEDLERDIRHIVHLVSLSDTIGVMSHMNASILKDEYLKIEEMLTANIVSSHILPEHLYHEQEDRFLKTENEVARLESISDISKTSEYPELSEGDRQATVQENILSLKEYEPQTQTTYTTDELDSNPIRQIKSQEYKKSEPKKQIAKTETKKNYEKAEKRKNKRKDEILSKLSYTKELSIKDITETFFGCSEKTIQRELNDLVDSKLVKKTGEKRWSRYTLA